MNYLLDTNICIYFFKGQFDLREKFKNVGYSNFAISEITLAELIYDAEKSQNRKKNMEVVEDFAERITNINSSSDDQCQGKIDCL